MEVAKFSTDHGISDETDFAWWVPYTFQKGDKIVYAANSRVKQITHKYVVAVSRSIGESYALDTKNGNTLWRDALDKEISNL